jgi:hypothetical protein
MNIFTDGLIVLSNQTWTVFSILLAILWGQILITALFGKIFKGQLTNSDYMSLGLAGWILPVTLFSAFLFAGVFLFGQIAEIVISAIAVIALGYAMFAGKHVGQAFSLTFSGTMRFGGLQARPVNTYVRGLLFLVSLAISLILQLAFLKKMLLPSYFDSAEHYYQIFC